jgi:hypothetical protein
MDNEMSVSRAEMASNRSVGELDCSRRCSWNGQKQGQYLAGIDNDGSQART